MPVYRPVASALTGVALGMSLDWALNQLNPFAEPWTKSAPPSAPKPTQVPNSLEGQSSELCFHTSLGSARGAAHQPRQEEKGQEEQEAPGMFNVFS